MSLNFRGTTFGYCKTHGDYCGSSCPFCQIAELNNKYDNRTHRNLNRVRKNEEVLQKFMKLMKNYNPQSWEGVNKLLKELDSPKTEKKKSLKDKMTLCFEDRLVAKKLGYMLVKRKDLQEIKRLLEQECTKLANPMINKLMEEYKIE